MFLLNNSSEHECTRDRLVLRTLRHPNCQRQRGGPILRPHRWDSHLLHRAQVLLKYYYSCSNPLEYLMNTRVDVWVYSCTMQISNISHVFSFAGCPPPLLWWVITGASWVPWAWPCTRCCFACPRVRQAQTEPVTLEDESGVQWFSVLPPLPFARIGITPCPLSRHLRSPISPLSSNSTFFHLLVL